jgi:hypothetical protein
LAGALTVTTSLPWFVAQLMPDVFTGVLVLALALLIFVPERLSPRERLWLVLFAAFIIATHQSHVPLTLVLRGIALEIPLTNCSGLARRGDDRFYRLV